MRASRFFLFELQDGDQTCTVVYFSGGSVRPKELTERLLAHHEHHLPPDRILVACLEPDAAHIAAVVGGDEFRGVLPGLTRYRDTPSMRFVTISDRAELRVDGAQALDGWAAHFWRTGLLKIFEDRMGFLPAGAGYHWVHPSGVHSDGFIRTGSVLRHSAEIAFVAAGLLRFWPEDCRRIYTDTATINTAAYALVGARRKFAKTPDDFVEPTIDSFSSYDGLEDFDFVDAGSLCLISATVKDGLKRRLIKERRLSAKSIATMFYCGREIPDSQVLCDLTARDDDQPGYLPFETHKRREDCPLCDRGVPTVAMIGDQLLPQDPQVASYLIGVKDQPRWLPDLLDDLLVEGVISCHADPLGDDRGSHEIHFDLVPALGESQKFARRISSGLLSSLPAALHRIIYLNDPSSRAVAELVERQWRTATGDDSQELLISAAEAERDPGELTCPDRSVLVVAGSVDTGRALLGVSQWLRKADTGHVAYLVGLARVPDESTLDHVTSNLTMPKDGEVKYPMLVVRKGNVPEYSDARKKTPWELESETWRALAAETNHKATQKAIRERHDVIRQAGVRGLVDDLFLPRITSAKLDQDVGRLRLREGFVFWGDLADKQRWQTATQAEVYFTVATILHHVRRPGPDGSRLLRREHNRSVIAPANFVRFNDGIIQAALLRAARPSEMDYSHDMDLSGQMQDIIWRFAQKRDFDEGEAFPEFVLALCSGRVTIEVSHARSLLRRLNPELKQFPLLIRALLEAFAQKVGTRSVQTTASPQAT